MIIKGLAINYIDYGNKNKTALVFLHGWGQNIQMMKGLGDQFLDNRVVIVDLPGFGASEEPKTVWTVDDYVDMLHELLQKLNIDCPIIIGHSFGGKIGLLYATKYKVKKLVCLASPYKKQVVQLSLKTKLLKTAKKVPGLKN